MNLQGEQWCALGELTTYRFLPAETDYDVTDPWAHGSGRFDGGGIPTLYMALSPEGAVAEFYRRHPELLDKQASVRLRLYRLTFAATVAGVNVSTQALADAVGIAWERLRSSDLRRATRYAECRVLAGEVQAQTGITVHYPSAAYEPVSCIVTFGAHQQGWSAIAEEVPVPLVDGALIRRLPVGAEP